MRVGSPTASPVDASVIRSIVFSMALGSVEESLLTLRHAFR